MSLTDAGHRKGSEALGQTLQKRPDRRRGWTCGPKEYRAGEPWRQARSQDEPLPAARHRADLHSGNVEISIALAAPACPTSRAFLHRRLSDAGHSMPVAALATGPASETLHDSGQSGPAELGQRLV